MGVSAFHRSYWDGRAYRRTKIHQHNHTFQFGDVVRWTGTSWVLASAATALEAEALGVVSHSGYRGEDGTLATEEYARRALPSTAFSHQTQTGEVCNDPRHYFSIVFRGEISIPRPDEIDYNQNVFLTGPDIGDIGGPVDWSTPYQLGTVYYLSPFVTSEGKLISKSPQEIGAIHNTTIVKPILITLDTNKAVVVNYIGSSVSSIPEEWVNIHDIQKVGAIGAFLETNIPDSWLICDGKLYQTAQYHALSEAIGGSVRVKASITLESASLLADEFTGITGYCLLDFSEESIDVSDASLHQPLNIKLESSTSKSERMVIVDSVVSRYVLRVYVDTQSPLDGTTGYVIDQPLTVKVRAPYSPGVDNQFFVPNLINRTVKGADTIAVFETEPNRQYDLGDYSGSNEVTLLTGTDIQGLLTGTGYGATIDNRADAIRVVFAIKANTVDCGTFINECCAPIVPVGLNENAIINGAFLVWQRGKEFTRNVHTAQPQYTADRWFEDFSIDQAPDTSTPGAQYHTLKKGVRRVNYNPAANSTPLEGDGFVGVTPAEELPDDIESYAEVQGVLMTTTVNSGHAVSTELLSSRQTYHFLENRIEDVRTMSGDNVTLSFWARGSESGTVYTALRQHFAGTKGILDDMYSAPVPITLSGSSVWEKYEIELNIPDVQYTKPSDAYIGTNSFLGVQFWTMYFAGECTGAVTNSSAYEVIPTPPPEENYSEVGGLDGGSDSGYGGGEGGVAGGPGAGCPYTQPCGSCGMILYVTSWQSCSPDVHCEPCADGTSGVCAASISCCSCDTYIYQLVQIPGNQVVGCPDPDTWTPTVPPLPQGVDTCGCPPIAWCIGGVCNEQDARACHLDHGPGEQYQVCCGPGPIGIGHCPLLSGNCTPPGHIKCVTESVAECIKATGGACGCVGGAWGGVANADVANSLCGCCYKCPGEPNGLWGAGGPGASLAPSATPSASSTTTPIPSATTPVPSATTPVPSATTPVPSATTPIPSATTPIPSTPPPSPSLPTPTPTKTPTPSPQTPTPTPTISSSQTPPPTPSLTVTPSPSVTNYRECVTDCCLPILFTSNFNYTGILHITGVQLIRGKASIPFEETDYLDELKRCQRYFEKDTHVAIGGSTKQGSTNEYFESVNYMVTKRRVKSPCVNIQGHFEPDPSGPDGITGCTLDDLEVDCYNTDSAVFHLSATPIQTGLGLCAAYVEYEVDVDLYESPCSGSCDGFICAWEEGS